MLVLPPIHILHRLDEHIGSGFNLIYRPRILIHDGLIKVEAVAVSHIFSLVFRLSVFLLLKGHIREVLVISRDSKIPESMDIISEVLLCEIFIAASNHFNPRIRNIFSFWEDMLNRPNILILVIS